MKRTPRSNANLRIGATEWNFFTQPDESPSTFRSGVRDKSFAKRAADLYPPEC